MQASDTIFALSSGPPPAAIAVIRVSGPAARSGLEALIGRVPPPRVATLSLLSDPADAAPIDQALVLWFPAPQSETGEDTAEFQIHGGRAVIAATLRALGALPGFRLAEPGEFTLRAFRNGRLDLPAVEGLADLIGAETEAQRRQAYRQMAGVLGKRAEEWRRRLIDALALVEASIDFSDEGDVPNDLSGPLQEAVAALLADMRAAVADSARGERLREGLSVVIAGPPNAGKSTLLNALARREVAIVSPYPGTTRDLLEVRLDLGGFPITLTDTAGLREATDPVERIGVERAWARLSEADLVLWLDDGTGEPERCEQVNAQSVCPVWPIRTKMDMNYEVTNRSLYRIEISAVTGSGVAELLEAIETFAARTVGGEPSLVVRQRQRATLEAACAALERAAGHDLPTEILAEELRAAAAALARLVGRVDVEDVLDRLFAEFCIGK